MSICTIDRYIYTKYMTCLSKKIHLSIYEIFIITYVCTNICMIVYAYACIHAVHLYVHVIF